MHKLVALALLAAAVAAVVAIPAAAKPPGTNGKIVTGALVVDGEGQVYTVDPDGTDEQVVADNTETGQWSPDGTLIDLFGLLLNPDDGSIIDLRVNLGTLYPDLFLGCGWWAPDGARLACEGIGETDPSLTGIYTVRASDGGDLQRVTSEPTGDIPRDYSPNGKRIVFARANALFTIKLDGSGLRQITPDGLGGQGSWSPQGNQIVFSARVPNADYRSTIWVVHSDGSGLRQLPVAGCGGLFSSPTSISCFNPSWSPDGTKIAFARLPAGGQRDLYTVNSDGSGLFRVTNTPDIEENGGDWGTHPVTP
jgi:Tol biopolymer transport system component